MIKNLFNERDKNIRSSVNTLNSNVKPKTAKSRHKSLHKMFKNQWELQKEYADHVIQDKYKDKDEKFNAMFVSVR